MNSSKFLQSSHTLTHKVVYTLDILKHPVCFSSMFLPSAADLLQSCILAAICTCHFGVFQILCAICNTFLDFDCLLFAHSMNINASVNDSFHELRGDECFACCHELKECPFLQGQCIPSFIPFPITFITYMLFFGLDSAADFSFFSASVCWCLGSIVLPEKECTMEYDTHYPRDDTSWSTTHTIPEMTHTHTPYQNAHMTQTCLWPEREQSLLRKSPSPYDLSVPRLSLSLYTRTCACTWPGLTCRCLHSSASCGHFYGSSRVSSCILCGVCKPWCVPVHHE